MSSEQFLRITRLVGQSAINKLHGKKVAIVGLGAVGGMCLETLSRSGVTNFRLIDFDTVSVTNINRQILATWETVDKVKVDVAKQRVLAINPDCKVEAINAFFSEETAFSLIDDSFDLVVDAIDSLNPKCALLSHCYCNNIKVISSMGAALKREPSLIQTADLFDTYGCPLAKLVRKRLRKRDVKKGINVVFSTEVPRYEYKDPEDEEDYDFNEEILERGRKRNVLGSLPTLTGIFALNLAHLALKELLGDDEFTGEPAFNSKDKFQKHQSLNKN